jgi:hypothetical protein
MSIQVQKASGHQTDVTKIETSPQHIVKTISTENKERILMAVKKKN